MCAGALAPAPYKSIYVAAAQGKGRAAADIDCPERRAAPACARRWRRRFPPAAARAKMAPMRAFTFFAALALVAAPMAAMPGVAHADGIERPRQPRPRPRPAPAPAPVIIDESPETVTLSDSFFAAGGGVGADIGTGYVGGGGVTVIVGGRASASAFAFARASARAHAGGRFHGRRGGRGCGC